MTKDVLREVTLRGRQQMDDRSHGEESSVFQSCERSMNETRYDK